MCNFKYKYVRFKYCYIWAAILMSMYQVPPWARLKVHVGGWGSLSWKDIKNLHF